MQNHPRVFEQDTDTSRRRTHISPDMGSPPFPTPTHGRRPRGGVGQDNPTPPRERTGTPQPGSVTQDMRSQQMSSNPPRSQKRPTPKRRTAQLILWVNPLVKAEIQRSAEREGLSISKVGAALLEKAIREDIHSQYSALIQPIIEQTVRKELRSFGNRIVFFLMRIAFASEQARILITNVLDRMNEVTQDSFTSIIDRSHKTARRNIIEKTPQIKTLLDEWEKSWKEEGREEHRPG
jgi:hypothetical protein